MTCLIVIFALYWCSGTKLVISPRDACIYFLCNNGNIQTDKQSFKDELYQIDSLKIGAWMKMDGIHFTRTELVLWVDRYILSIWEIYLGSQITNSRLDEEHRIRIKRVHFSHGSSKNDVGIYALRELAHGNNLRVHWWDELIMKFCFIYTVEYSSSTEKNGLSPFVATWL